jgi:hypothetical protein
MASNARHERRNFAWIPLVDILMNSFMGFVALFALAIISQGKPTDGNITLKGEYLITMEWQTESSDDMDLWVRQGNGDAAGFRGWHKDIRSMSLDRDNMGSDDWLYDDAGSRVKRLPKREMITVRGIMPGKYTVNGYLYKHEPGSPNPRAYVEVIRLNPYMVVFQGEKEFTVAQRDQTYLTFTIDKDGDYHDVDEYFEDPFVAEILAKDPSTDVRNGK